MWLFPLYLLAINLFVLPIAIGGLLQFGAGVDADTFVLALPLAEGQDALALVAFIGGLSAVHQFTRVGPLVRVGGVGGGAQGRQRAHRSKVSVTASVTSAPSAGEVFRYVRHADVPRFTAVLGAVACTRWHAPR